MRYMRLPVSNDLRVVFGVVILSFSTGCPSLFVKVVDPPFAKGEWMGTMRPTTLYRGNNAVPAMALVIQSGPDLKNRERSVSFGTAGNSAFLVDEHGNVDNTSQALSGATVAIIGEMYTDFLYDGREPLRRERAERPGHLFLLRPKTVRPIGGGK